MTVVYVSVIIQSVLTIADFMNVYCWARVFSMIHVVNYYSRTYIHVMNILHTFACFTYMHNFESSITHYVPM